MRSKPRSASKNFAKYLLIIPLSISISSSFIFQNKGLAFASDNPSKIEKRDILTINMADVGHLPWDYEVSGVHTVETFSAAVHGSQTSIYDSYSKTFSTENTLLESYSCKEKICQATLKKGVYFHNNREVNAYDVEFSLVKNLLTTDGSSITNTILDDINGIDNINKDNIFYTTYNSIVYPTKVVDGIEVIDSHNIIFKLKRKNNKFFERISDGKLPIVPVEEFDQSYKTWKQYPIGFGKYKVTNANYLKNEYFLEKASKEEKIPKYVKMIFGSENGGDITLILGAPNRGIKNQEEIVIFDNVYSNAGFLYNFQTELGKNLNFRKAISLALDRNKIAQTSLFKEMQAEDQMLPNSNWQKQFRANISVQSQKVNEAKQLLSQIPEKLWKNKVFYVPTFWEDTKDINSLPYINEIQKQLKDIGIETIFCFGPHLS